MGEVGLPRGPSEQNTDPPSTTPSPQSPLRSPLLKAHIPIVPYEANPRLSPMRQTLVHSGPSPLPSSAHCTQHPAPHKHTPLPPAPPAPACNADPVAAPPPLQVTEAFQPFCDVMKIVEELEPLWQREELVRKELRALHPQERSARLSAVAAEERRERDHEEAALREVEDAAMKREREEAGTQVGGPAELYLGQAGR